MWLLPMAASSPEPSYPVASRHSAIDPGHKVAILPIKAGEAVVKYAQAIGRATEDIAPGTHIHSHNLVFDRAACRSCRLPILCKQATGTSAYLHGLPTCRRTRRHT
jgi:hypothetical protein